MGAFDNIVKLYGYIRPILDISVMAFILYKAYQLVTKTNALQIIKAAVIVAFAYALALLLDLDMLRWVMNMIAPALVVCFAIVFQPEIRKFLLYIGDGRLVHFFSDRFAKQTKTSSYVQEIEAVKSACRHAECLRCLCGTQKWMTSSTPAPESMRICLPRFW